LEAIKPNEAVPIIKAMLKNQGVDAAAGIMKLMDPAKVAAIMAIPNGPIWHGWGDEPRTNLERDKFLPRGTASLTVQECVDILKAMGGLKEDKGIVRAIVREIFKLNPYKAMMINSGLRGGWLPNPWLSHRRYGTASVTGGPE